MAKKGNKGSKKKWCTEDLDFDENGNLLITNRALAKAVVNAIYRTDRRFRIRVKRGKGVAIPGVFDKLNARAAKKGDPVDGKQESADDSGRPPMDAMCPC